MREEFLAKFSVQRGDETDSPNYWHWSSDAIFPVSHGSEVQEQWPALSNIKKSNVGSGTKECDKPASKDNDSSASKEWSRVVSTPETGIAKPKVTNPTNLKKPNYTRVCFVSLQAHLLSFALVQWFCALNRIAVFLIEYLRHDS